MPKSSRSCRTCGSDITHRYRTAKLCESCSHTALQWADDPNAASRGTCAVNDAECTPGPLYGGTHCRKHHYRLRKFGTTSLPPKVDPFTRYQVTSTECWEWTGPVNEAGYGQFPSPYVGTRQAHRAFYIHHVGPVADELDIDHLCRNPPCVNPAHLEPVTHQVNVQRGWDATLAGWCQKGIHELKTAADWYVPRKGNRQCYRCMRERNLVNCRQYRARKRAAQKG